MHQITEEAKLVRRENDDRRSSGGGIELFNNCLQGSVEHDLHGEDDLYDKIPSYLTVFSHSEITSIKDHNDVLNEYISKNENCGLKRNLYSLPNYLNLSYSNDSDEYSRLPAYTMDLSQSLLYDEDFERKIVISKSNVSVIPEARKIKMKSKKIEKDSVDNRKVVFIGHIPPYWQDFKFKLEMILKDIQPPVVNYLRKIDIKNRFHNNLDSYAFLHFTESKAAFDTMEYFQNHNQYKICNVSLAGRDDYYNGRKYSDIECERGFSAMNLMVTPTRSYLLTRTISIGFTTGQQITFFTASRPSFGTIFV